MKKPQIEVYEPCAGPGGKKDRLLYSQPPKIAAHVIFTTKRGQVIIYEENDGITVSTTNRGTMMICPTEDSEFRIVFPKEKA